MKPRRMKAPTRCLHGTRSKPRCASPWHPPGEHAHVVAVPLEVGLGGAGHAGGELALHAREHLAVADRLQEVRRLRLGTARAVQRETGKLGEQLHDNSFAVLRGS